jgi:hypothetical protein
MKASSLKALFRAALLGAIVTAPACDSQVEDAESSRKESTFATEEADGVVTGTFLKGEAGTMVASPTSEVADASVDVPADALAVDTEVSIGEATDLSSALGGDLGIGQANPLVSSSAPVYIGPHAATEVASPLSIALPLPLASDSLGLNATTLASAKLVFMYLIYVDGGYKAGIKALTAANLVGTFVNMEVKGFGYFQIAYFADEVEETEIDSTRAPKLK